MYTFEIDFTCTGGMYTFWHLESIFTSSRQNIHKYTDIKQHAIKDYIFLKTTQETRSNNKKVKQTLKQNYMNMILHY